MRDAHTEQRRQWIAAGAPGVTLRFAPCLHRDEYGRNTFVYTPAHATNVAETFRRARQQLGIQPPAKRRLALLGR